ncbi:hypothetical protein Clacol_009896 [Clathrus columnatus]|uniref:Uncharacterized protein n=1 Tax=Clathrus columnatus TaxID=1419009 RepID=A0AAV5AQ38_9AGAM|nr:hypothetical protein Clacol_009896 [Clathrus columnatus]
MATVTVTSHALNTHNPLAPSWDEAIVPTLRKRLESESRILTQRLSTISVSTDDSKQQQPQQQQQQSRPQSPADTHDTQHTTSSSRRTPNGTRSHTPTSVYPSQRPSAIPRPSYSRTNERLNTSTTRHDTPAPPAESSSLDGNQPATRRKRTQSTPFPFEPSSDPANTPSSSVPNGKQVSSTNSGQAAAKSHGGRTTPTPSRIPTVPSRIRSGSQSSQGLSGTVGKSMGTKIQASETNPINGSELLSNLVQMKSSSSSTSQQQRISEDHQTSSGNVQQRRGVDENINERISSDEERPFQHWYRGDVSRNGGVGEYRVGKRIEMLDIASFGHASSGKTRRTKVPDGHVVPPSQFSGKPLRKRAESVSSIERTSLFMETPDETIMGRVLDETPLTDVDSNIDRRLRRQSIASMEEMSLYMESSDLSKALDEPSGMEGDIVHDAQNQSATKHPPSENTKKIHLPTSKQDKPADTRSRNMSNARHEAKGSTSTTSSVPETASSRNGRPPRGRAQSPVERSRTPGRKVDQKRSKSAADALRLPESSVPAEFSGLTDAVPDTRTPIPVDGNWDEMILPTVARRMGIEYEKTESIPPKSSQPQIVPAPGTFGFDYSKYKPSRPSEEAMVMTEFGTRTPISESKDLDEGEPAQQLESMEPAELPIDKPPPPTQQMRPRRDTLPPFAHYTEAPKERQDMPQVIIAQQDTEMNPQPQATVYVEEGEQSIIPYVHPLFSLLVSFLLFDFLMELRGLTSALLCTISKLRDIVG